ncbi:hypothetical protein BGZ67_009625 [Mortierella alpina]|nr:hypothetical protein BGZ67_009625 [Mortierella alpina]
MTTLTNEDQPNLEDTIHVFRKHLCLTGERARKRNPREISVGTHGLIPLWAEGCTLKYRINERTLQQSGRNKREIIELFNKAIVLWGDAAPIKFKEDSLTWDFEVIVRKYSDCNQTGCVLASAFFPGAGQEKFEIYPTMFEQSEAEQVETMLHELGHVFGLRHWFAKVEDGLDPESGWKSHVFGSDDPVTIMNYDDNSRFTENDKKDLKELYRQAWSGELTQINKTPVVLFKPYLARPTR